MRYRIYKFEYISNAGQFFLSVNTTGLEKAKEAAERWKEERNSRIPDSERDERVQFTGRLLIEK